ncbi:phage protein Gp36 family protein [Soonwooa sp.]|uniref:phage protein Gp36 family protein n=1 Tax=Soonwooa sp. TaxID=1938592 RepID=UPI0028A9F410|nr:phage protein Gp36 family protein [Soonwooa sp.]
MKYLDLDYLYTHAFERAITESTADFDKTLDNLESETIDLVKSYLSQYYDIDKIFSLTAPIKNGVLSKVMTKIILYEAVRRNAYRKVPTDYNEDYKWAIETLEKLNSGKLTLHDLPPKGNADGSDNSRLMWGNLSNKNNYI